MKADVRFARGEFGQLVHSSGNHFGAGLDPYPPAAAEFQGLVCSRARIRGKRCVNIAAHTEGQFGFLGRLAKCFELNLDVNQHSVRNRGSLYLFFVLVLLFAIVAAIQQGGLENLDQHKL